jgi:hypothetical protein
MTDSRGHLCTLAPPGYRCMRLTGHPGRCDPEQLPGTADAVEIFRLIEILRSQEADSVTINADNADFFGPNSVVECNGDWTNWEDKRFSGDNLLGALEAAAEAKKAAESS